MPEHPSNDLPAAIDGDTPPDPSSLTTDEALAAMRLTVTKLPAADGLMRLAAAAGWSPVEWNDLPRREVVRAHEVMSGCAMVYGEWQPVGETRTQEEMEADDKLAAEHSRLAEEHGLISYWSVNGADDLDPPHPYPHATTLVYETISGDTDRGRVWGGDGGRFVASIPGPRWLDLWVAADAAIQASGDLHHRFLEYFTAGDDPTELHLATGS